jgi:hypothetical protein
MQSIPLNSLTELTQIRTAPTIADALGQETSPPPKNDDPTKGLLEADLEDHFDDDDVMMMQALQEENKPTTPKQDRRCFYCTIACFSIFALISIILVATYAYQPALCKLYSY